MHAIVFAFLMAMMAGLLACLAVQAGSPIFTGLAVSTGIASILITMLEAATYIKTGQW